MNRQCNKCGGTMEEGHAAAEGTIRTSFTAEPGAVTFVVPGTPTSSNPITAVKQGLDDEPGERRYAIRGFRCSRCGLLELYAVESSR